MAGKKHDRLFDGLLPDTPTEKDDKLFKELQKSHYEWVENALARADEDMVIAIIGGSAVAGAVRTGLGKDYFFEQLSKVYDRFERQEREERETMRKGKH